MHTHPHELLASVVKERFDQAFRLNRGRAFYSSLVSRQAVFEEVFSFFSTAYAFDQLSASRQREANSTAFKPAVNHLFQPLSIHLTEAPTEPNHRPVSPAHST